MHDTIKTMINVLLTCPCVLAPSLDEVAGKTLGTVVCHSAGFTTIIIISIILIILIFIIIILMVMVMITDITITIIISIIV